MKRDIDWDQYPALSNDIHWGVVKARYVCDDELDEGLVSNVTILPFAGDRCVIFQVADGSWELPGGTLEPGEGYMDALRREVREELGAELESFRLIGQFHCESSALGPFRPHIPHPRFVRAVGYGDVRLAFEPLNPEGAEQVIAVETVELDEAVRRFVQNGRDDIADLYRLAYACRKRDREEAD
ncbi:NUDIX hydrolase [Paenibacillus ihbetae]|uniref:NUDIX hydrolase n=1 Tax=Paenibacillus ihbetae TaxID=1870820 RepID=A0A1B2E5U7_9BACL|nr:NUDIX domain-containing protein [Paenibacillus ihbetae]ANY75344.1 NUDIX hydrolase [Paenibacillus ihbetae]